MFPSKLGDKIVIKCKCGFIKPFIGNETNVYKITTDIKHSFNEESIFLCACSQKFLNRDDFLEHSRTCQKCKEHNFIIREKLKEEKLLVQKKRETRSVKAAKERIAVAKKTQELKQIRRAKLFLQTLIDKGYLIYYRTEGLIFLKKKVRCFNCGSEVSINDYIYDKLIGSLDSRRIDYISLDCPECKLKCQIDFFEENKYYV